ncbi:hypothetical protein N7532_010041 [Penicillium argentinense]|uniref:Histone deacetylase interacting domain-containing protein n=1 Tax=Penicillium argentinense TaxID=1131581 RepID=A0A9W9EP25_9EURO|nr:uncharacterized protein N7532_010041 [Penicillium argentinense]KAJ5085270.1 hypothetical protein N7532_010041 [Penicillium argentinense]
MNSGNDSWHSPAGGPPAHPGMDQMNQQPRPLGSFRTRIFLIDNGFLTFVVCIEGPYHPAGQSGGHSLPGLAELSQSHGTPHQPPAYGQHPAGPSHGSGHSLPGLGQAMSHASPQLNRERERDSREREILERQRQEEMAHREREQREREQMERQQMERQQIERQRGEHHPVQSHTGSIPLHQPVASKVPNSIHGPNGLLSNLGTNPPNGPGNVQSSGGPAALFGGPQMPQHGEGTPRSYMQYPGGPPMMGHNGQGQQIPGNVAALAQGQQPILNASDPIGPAATLAEPSANSGFVVQDALSYLDQVKVRFVDQPDVYNRFLDIMKDFKSQAIDTPGVIQRVSTLFNGHPALIQGFNTFLPPGYRIECGTEDNPDAIRVTTPSGTNTLSMPRAGRPFETTTNDIGPSSGPRPDYYEQSRPGWQQTQQQQGQQGHPGSYSPGSRMMGPSLYQQQESQGPGQEHHYGYQSQEQQGAAALSHQQDHRGVAQLQGAASAASAGLGRPGMMAASGAGQNASLTQPMNSLAGVGGMLQGGHADLNKRGPVEFNHAISYVNKIKNRFSSAPEIYKQFLEILQTYQRESKPIQDVYAQVTQLFNTAPDLLEDFKQFLPESAAHAKQQAANRAALEESIPISNMRGGDPMGLSQASNRDAKNLPPIGSFKPHDSVKDNKKRRGPGMGGSVSGPTGTDARIPESQLRGQPAQFGHPSKKAKYHHGKPSGADIPNVSPTLIPALPEPLPPGTSVTPNSEELAFFDRVKKFIANKQVYADFLKLCNLYTTDLIDRFVLVKRAENFIGSNAELMSWFRRFMSADETEDRAIDPKPKTEAGSVNLAHCRSLGPSYRLLPKRERQKACSGRDQLCFEVLNDEWASHPTWASEDSGFVAHRKNQYEDALHRIEEDRHDYDHHIEACTRTIQLIEPICQQFLHMSEAERANFKLPPGLGGQSEAIYQRVIKKVYDRARGEKVIHDMFARPTQVLPVVLYRLKQKLEEWRACQREWDKVWREQMQRAYWRSLDHQAIATRASDKKLFIAKNIQQDLQGKFEETQNRLKSGLPTKRYQAEFQFSDVGVLLDTTHLLCMYIDRSTSGVGTEPARLISFLKDFIPIFFGLDRETFHDYMDELAIAASPAEELEENFGADEISNASRKVVSTQKLDLLRETLERRGTNGTQTKENGAPAPTQLATPDVRGTSAPASEPEDTFDVAELKWMEHPGQGNFHLEHEYTLNKKYKKIVHHMYCNLNILCFLRTFEILYSRLLRIKEQEGEAREQIRRGLLPKAANDLSLIDRYPSDFFYDVDPKANLYKQIVRMCEDVIRGDMDQVHLEETLRRFYMQSGFLMYNLERIFSSIAKFVATIFTGDSRDRSSDIANLFFKEREKDEATHHQEIQYRKQVERLIKEGDMYRVTYVSVPGLTLQWAAYPTNTPPFQHPSDSRVTFQVMTPEEATLDRAELSPEARWSYYVTAYSMRDPTEGVSISEMRMPILKRNLPGKLDEDEEYDRFYRHLQHYDGLVIRICANNYTILYQPSTNDWFWHSTTPVPDKDADPEAAQAQIKSQEEEKAKEQAALKEKRHDRFVEKFVNNPNWARGLSKDKVDESNQRFRSWLNGTLEATPAPAAADASAPESAPAPAPVTKDGDKMDEDKPEQGDTEMADAEPEGEAAVPAAEA